MLGLVAVWAFTTVVTVINVSNGILSTAINVAAGYSLPLTPSPSQDSFLGILQLRRDASRLVLCFSSRRNQSYHVAA